MVDYITKELSQRTNNKRIIDAYERNAITVIVLDKRVFYVETDYSDSIRNMVIKETKRLFPELTYLYERR